MEISGQNQNQERRDAFEKGELYGAQTTRSLIERNFPRLSEEELTEKQKELSRETLNPLLRTELDNALDLLSNQDKLQTWMDEGKDMVKRSLTRPDLASRVLEKISRKLYEPAIEDLRSLDLSDPKIRSSALKYDVGRGILFVASRIAIANDQMRSTLGEHIESAHQETGFSVSDHMDAESQIRRDSKTGIQLLEQDPDGYSLVQHFTDALDKGDYPNEPDRSAFIAYGGKFAETAYNAIFPITARFIKSD